MDDLLQRVRRCEALQQPEWGDPSRLRDVQAYLRGSPALIRAGDILALRATLARVARGEALVVQCGDCAEDMDDHHAENVARKAAVLELLAGALRLAGRRPVIRVGRIAGQYAKPRSKPHEQVGEQTLPVYRGDMVNGREAHAEQRRADPQRILKGYAAARNIMRHLGWDAASGQEANASPVWTSHEMLLLDYELSMLREDEQRRVYLGSTHWPWMDAASGQEANASPVWTSHEMLLLDYELSMLREDEQRRVYLGSTHWPWIGERTRQVDGAHVALLAEVLNPVACKVGPEIGRDQLLALCERLDPRREPGRLTLIARMGAQKVGERLPPLVEAVRAAGHPVIWLSDPMHGNTIVAPCGNKTRLVRSIAEEVAAFRLAVSGSGGVAAGLHLETTPDDVTECVADSSGLHQVGRHYTSLCDPRLNPWQALSAVMAWAGAEATPSATFPLETVA
ncbi:3-deoxy-7-phosphoheptulonate synthase [Pseudomonas aeruginosa]|uniref:3-deoxy-7-phosphoheptulonate synthase n=1 Tax=Pseudomonas aeruginosa TaxID=287 RepID=UPI000BB90D0E|nr:phospho-2-dehydro-3-deoxyheptonate aldolase [Pseudomonas aeruginosa]